MYASHFSSFSCIPVHRTSHPYLHDPTSSHGIVENVVKFANKEVGNIFAFNLFDPMVIVWGGRGGGGRGDRPDTTFGNCLA